jgi:hypothetical protein
VDDEAIVDDPPGDTPNGGVLIEAEAVICNQCGKATGEPLGLPYHLPDYPRSPCPHGCGCYVRTYRYKYPPGYEPPKRPKGGKPTLRMESRLSWHGSTGRLHVVQRTYDRKSNRYVEHITDAATGEIVLHVDEPLTEHRSRRK